MIVFLDAKPRKNFVPFTILSGGPGSGQYEHQKTGSKYNLPSGIGKTEAKSFPLHSTWYKHPNWKQQAYGGVMVNNAGKFLLREPAGHFDGYAWTWPKGKMDHPDEHPVDTATRELKEETGYNGRIFDAVPGTFTSGTGSRSNFFLMRSHGADDEPDHETQGLKWADYHEAKQLISQSPNKLGRLRDLAILEYAKNRIEKHRVGPNADGITASSYSKLGKKLCNLGNTLEGFLFSIACGGGPSDKGPGSGNYVHQHTATGQFHQHSAVLKNFGFKMDKEFKGQNPSNPKLTNVTLKSVWSHPKFGTIHIDHMAHTFEHVSNVGIQHAPLTPAGKNNLILEQHLLDHTQQPQAVLNDVPKLVPAAEKPITTGMTNVQADMHDTLVDHGYALSGKLPGGDAIYGHPDGDKAVTTTKSGEWDWSKASEPAKDKGGYGPTTLGMHLDDLAIKQPLNLDHDYAVNVATAHGFTKDADNSTSGTTVLTKGPQAVYVDKATGSWTHEKSLNPPFSDIKEGKTSGELDNHLLGLKQQSTAPKPVDVATPPSQDPILKSPTPAETTDNKTAAMATVLEKHGYEKADQIGQTQVYKKESEKNGMIEQHVATLATTEGMTSVVNNGKYAKTPEELDAHLTSLHGAPKPPPDGLASEYAHANHTHISYKWDSGAGVYKSNQGKTLSPSKMKWMEGEKIAVAKEPGPGSGNYVHKKGPEKEKPAEHDKAVAVAKSAGYTETPVQIGNVTTLEKAGSNLAVDKNTASWSTGTKSGTGAQELEDHLKSTPPAVKTPHDEMVEVAKNAGYKVGADSDKATVLSKPGATLLVYKDESGKWQHVGTGALVAPSKTGTGAYDLEQHLKSSGSATPASTPAASSMHDAVVTTALAQGFKPDPNMENDKVSVLSKNSEVIGVNKETGAWTHTAPGGGSVVTVDNKPVLTTGNNQIDLFTHLDKKPEASAFVPKVAPQFANLKIALEQSGFLVQKQGAIKTNYINPAGDKIGYFPKSGKWDYEAKNGVTNNGVSKWSLQSLLQGHANEQAVTHNALIQKGYKPTFYGYSLDTPGTTKKYQLGDNPGNYVFVAPNGKWSATQNYSKTGSGESSSSLIEHLADKIPSAKPTETPTSVSPIAVTPVGGKDAAAEAASKAVATSNGFKQLSQDKFATNYKNDDGHSVSVLKDGSWVHVQPNGNFVEGKGQDSLKQQLATITPGKPTDRNGDLKYAGSAKGLGGAFDKHFFTDKDGNKYMFKPAQTLSGQTDPIKAHVDEAASKIQAILRPDANVPVTTAKLDLPDKKDVLGSLQKMLPLASKPNFANVDPFELKPNEVKALQQEQVVDWLTANHDSHGSNFIRTADGKTIGIDKSQSFKNLGSDKLSTSYHPNTMEAEPYYNKLFSAIKSGQQTFNPKDSLQTIKNAQAIPDSEYKAILKPYVDARFKNDADKDKFYQQALDRKANLKTDFEKFYSDALGKPFSFGGNQPVKQAEYSPKPDKVTQEMHESLEDHGFKFSKYGNQSGNPLYKDSEGKAVYAKPDNNWEFYPMGTSGPGKNYGASSGTSLDDLKNQLTQPFEKPGEDGEVPVSKSYGSNKDSSGKLTSPFFGVLPEEPASGAIGGKGYGKILPSGETLGGDPSEHATLVPGQKYTDSERKAVNSYKASSEALNHYAHDLIAKDKKEGSSHYDNWMNNIDSAVKKYVTNKPLVIFRGIGKGFDGEEYAQKVINELFTHAGALHVPATFQETSTQEDTPRSFAGTKGLVFRIHVPKGTPVIPTTTITSSHQYEYGMIFGRKTKYKLNKMYASNGITYADVDMIPGDMTASGLVGAHPANLSLQQYMALQKAADSVGEFEMAILSQYDKDGKDITPVKNRLMFRNLLLKAMKNAQK